MKVIVNEMYLYYRRQLYLTGTPVVHAFCTFLHEGQYTEIPVIVGSSQVKELNNLDNVIKLNYRLFGPIPYEGGQVELLLALFNVQTADYGKDFLDLLGSISQITGVGELSTALQLLKPLKNGLEGLFGLNKCSPHIGIDDTFSSEAGAAAPLTEGYRVVVNADETKMRGKQLWVKQGRLQCGDSLANAQPFSDADYILFQIQSLDARDDWTSLNSIKQAWDNVVMAATKANKADTNSAYAAFRSIVLTSPDLIWSDRIRIVDALRKRVTDISNVPETVRGKLTHEEKNKIIDKEISDYLQNAPPAKEAIMRKVEDIPESV
jgi:hypothetical protein